MTRLRLVPLLIAVAATSVLAAAGSWVGHACFVRAPQPVQVWADHIEVDISNQVAQKRYECVFLNPNASAVVGGMCYMEVEPGAQVDNMTLQIGNKTVKGEILDRKKANKVFTDIVRQGGSPALLEYYGNKLIRTRIPKIPPRGTVTVHLHYTTVLKRKGGLTRISLLNTNPKAKLQALKNASVTIKLKSDEPITNVYSPTHDIKAKEAVGEDALVVSWKQENYLPKNPFVLYYATSAKQRFGVNLLTYREPAERGYFMTMISPTQQAPKGADAKPEVLPKDIVFCVDTSFSMNENGKIEQARKGLTYCVENLREGDRFNIVDFSTEARTFAKGLVTFDAKSKQRALNYVADLEASGGTAIHEALSLSLDQFAKDDARLKMIVFMTDGLPTIGERDPKQILQQITGKNTDNVRLFVFGEGYDVNTQLLDVLASDNRGDSDYILPKEDIAGRIAKFFDKVGSPVMTDLEIAIEGVKASDIFPRQLPDLFKGDQVVVYGRYDISGPRKVTLCGNVRGERKTLEYTIDFPAESDRHDFVPRLWAGQKVSDLLATLRKSGNDTNQELIAEVTSLAKRFGIVTPYTAYLVTEDVVSADAGGPARPGAPRRKIAQQLAKSRQRGFGGAAGASAADRAEEAKEAFRLAAARRSLRAGKADHMAGELMDAEGDDLAAHRNQTMRKLRYIGARTFYRSGDYWFDSRFDASKVKAVDVPICSEQYFELIAKHKVNKFFALGNVVLPIGDTWYRITPRKK